MLYLAHQDCEVTHRALAGTVWSASLSLVDLRSGANSFYKLQVIVDTERSANQRVTFFRAWGRLGTLQGDKRIAEMGLAAAKAEFCEHFLAKTGNAWEDRANFKKQPRMFDLVDVAYDDDAADSSRLPYVLHPYPRIFCEDDATC